MSDSDLWIEMPHDLPGDEFIDFVNSFTQDEAKRCRILLANVLLRLEQLGGNLKVDKTLKRGNN